MLAEHVRALGITPRCPFCGTEQRLTVLHVVAPWTLVQPEGVPAGEHRVIPLVPAVCERCQCVVFFAWMPFAEAAASQKGA